MSAKKELAGKDQQIAELESLLAEAKGDAATHLRNLERHGANPSRMAELEQQVEAMAITIRGLTEERDTAVAAVEAMRIEDLEAGFAS
jgi:cytochrome P450